MWMVALILLNMTFWLARFLKPAIKTADLLEKHLEENKKSRLELAKAADEISQLRKYISQNKI